MPVLVYNIHVIKKQAKERTTMKTTITTINNGKFTNYIATMRNIDNAIVTYNTYRKAYYAHNHNNRFYNRLNKMTGCRV